MRAGSSPAPRSIGAALILLGVGGAATSMGISLDQYGRWGARIFPLAGSISLILLGLAEIWGARASIAPRPDLTHVPRIIALLALSVAYVWVTGLFGYLISTALAAPAALLVFGVRSPVGLAAAATLCPAVYHMIFFEALGVFPPLGRWFDLLDLL